MFGFHHSCVSVGLMHRGRMHAGNGGSAALDLCRIASGSNVAYLELKLQPYDYAAASVIIEEAGGCITRADGSPITLDRPCSIMAGTKSACEEVREILQHI